MLRGGVVHASGLGDAEEFFFHFSGFFFVFFFVVREREREVVLKEKKEDRPENKKTCLPNVRVGREVVVDRVGGAKEARADGGEERVDLLS